MYLSFMAEDVVLRAVCFLSITGGGGEKHLLNELTSTPRGKKKIKSLEVSRISVLPDP